MKCKTCHRWWLVFLITCKNCKGWSESWHLHWDGTDANHFPYAQCIKMQHALKQHKHIIILIMSPFSLLDSAKRVRKTFADPFTLQYFVISLSLEHKNVTLPWQKAIHSFIKKDVAFFHQCGKRRQAVIDGQSLGCMHIKCTTWHISLTIWYLLSAVS